MKQIKQKNKLLLLLLLCVIACAIAVIIATFGNTTKTAFAATDDATDPSTTLIVFSIEGVTMEPQTVIATYGEPMPEITVPTREHYKFKGFFSMDGVQYYGENMKSVRNWDQTTAFAILYGQWEGEKHKVYFDFQGGEGGTEFVEVEYGKDMPEAVKPVREGYNFLGYYTQPIEGGTKYYNENMYSRHVWNSAVDGVLYARWDGIVYEVTLGSQTTVDQKMGEPMVEAEIPVETGYIFEGYFLNLNGEEIQYYNSDMSSARNWDIPRNETLYAKYTAVVVNITLDANGGLFEVNEEMVNSYTFSLSYSDNEGLDLNKFIPNRVANVFLGWYNDDILYDGKIIRQTKDLTLTASWRQRLNCRTLQLLPENSEVDLSKYASEELIIKLPHYDFDSYCRLIIPASIKRVHIYADYYRTYKFCVLIDGRATDFDLYLENFKMVAPVVETSTGYTVYSAIQCSSKINLYSYGQVHIEGAPGIIDSNGRVYDAGYGIWCGTLYMAHVDKNLFISGGYAGNTKSKPGYGVCANKIYEPEINGARITGGYTYDYRATALPLNPGIEQIFY